MKLPSLLKAGIVLLCMLLNTNSVAAGTMTPPLPDQETVAPIDESEPSPDGSSEMPIDESESETERPSDVPVDDSDPTAEDSPAQQEEETSRTAIGTLEALGIGALVVLLIVLLLLLLQPLAVFQQRRRHPRRVKERSSSKTSIDVAGQVEPTSENLGGDSGTRTPPASDKTGPTRESAPVSRERVRPLVAIGPEGKGPPVDGVGVPQGDDGQAISAADSEEMDAKFSFTSDRSLDPLLPESSPGPSPTPTPVPSDLIRVVPPQIGEPSAFAARSWWDSRDDWCQLAPSGMSSDVTCDVGTAGSLAVAAASLRGHKHKFAGMPCQDAFSVRVSAGEEDQSFLIAVSCDGLSSARFSHYGARRTAELLSAELRDLVEAQVELQVADLRADISEILRGCAERLIPTSIDAMGALGILDNSFQPSDFNTTLTFALIPTRAGRASRTSVIVGGIGDSPIFLLRRDQAEWEPVSLSSIDEQLLNPATAAFPATTSAIVSQIEISSGDVLVMMSDGVGNYVRKSDQQFALGRYLVEQWRRPKALTAFINDVAFDLKSADDDRTVIAVWAGRE